jgi:hypothetical protein
MTAKVKRTIILVDSDAKIPAKKYNTRGDIEIIAERRGFDTALPLDAPPSPPPDIAKTYDRNAPSARQISKPVTVKIEAITL